MFAIKSKNFHYPRPWITHRLIQCSFALPNQPAGCSCIPMLQEHMSLCPCTTSAGCMPSLIFGWFCGMAVCESSLLQALFISITKVISALNLHPWLRQRLGLSLHTHNFLDFCSMHFLGDARLHCWLIVQAPNIIFYASLVFSRMLCVYSTWVWLYCASCCGVL